MTNAPDTRARFLAAIAGRLSRETVAEVHLFQPIKQGGTESGVAVIAASDPEVIAVDVGMSADASEEGGDDASRRLAVYTATYRLTLKGPDRGKWDFTIQADADAPLVTVDAVVRGVQRRSGDAQEPEKLTREEFLAALPPSAPATASPS